MADTKPKSSTAKRTTASKSGSTNSQAKTRSSTSRSKTASARSGTSGSRTTKRSSAAKKTAAKKPAAKKPAAKEAGLVERPREVVVGLHQALRGDEPLEHTGEGGRNERERPRRRRLGQAGRHQGEGPGARRRRRRRGSRGRHRPQGPRAPQDRARRPDPEAPAERRPKALAKTVGEASAQFAKTSKSVSKDIERAGDQAERIGKILK